MKNVVSLYPPQNSTIFKTGFCVAKKKVVFLGGGIRAVVLVTCP